MTAPHKHAALIKAWADGAMIECKVSIHTGWHLASSPCWDDDTEYRIKPEPKPDRIVYAHLSLDKKTDELFTVTEFFNWTAVRTVAKVAFTDTEVNVQLTFDDETGALKSIKFIE